MICQKKAKNQGKYLSPTEDWWTRPPWVTFFKQQIITANTLLRTYSFEAIKKALDDKRSERTYSLRAPWLAEIIREYENVKEKPVETIVIETQPVKFNPRQSKGLRSE